MRDINNLLLTLLIVIVLWAALLASLDPAGAVMRLLASPFVGVRS
ncbi:hypothetical protein RHDC3_02554 [Rhodocyclaceae bacterium]|nr:hypothetical protein RHDC3_02554 [Rhodocyclaceae bacterium]